jgi:uncharacterized membrane protein
MSFDARLNANVYTTRDLIGLAKIKAFGNHSDVVLQALIKLSQYEDIYPETINELDKTQKALKASNEALSKTINLSGTIEEIKITKF